MAEITKELGRIPVSRGNYQSTTEYYKDNIVQYKRGSYQVVSESPIVGIPPTNDKNVVNPGWTLFAGTLDAQNVVNQIKEQETKSIQAVAAREAEILAKSDASEISASTGSLEGNNVQDNLNNVEQRIVVLEKDVIDYPERTVQLTKTGYVGENGVLVYSSEGKNTGFVYIGGRTSLKLDTQIGSSGYGLAFYSDNQENTFLSAISIRVISDEIEINLQSDEYASAKYVIVSSYNAQKDCYLTLKEKKGITHDIAVLQESSFALREDVDNINNKLKGLQSLYPLSNIGYISVDTGQLQPDGNSRNTGLISIAEVSKCEYKTSIGDSGCEVAFYTDNTYESYLPELTIVGKGMVIIDTINLKDEKYKDAKYIVISSYGYTEEAYLKLLREGVIPHIDSLEKEFKTAVSTLDNKIEEVDYKVNENKSEITAVSDNLSTFKRQIYGQTKKEYNLDKNGYIEASSGNLNPSSSGKNTGFVQITGCKKLIYSTAIGDSGYAVAFYKSQDYASIIHNISITPISIGEKEVDISTEQYSEANYVIISSYNTPSGTYLKVEGIEGDIPGINTRIEQVELGLQDATLDIETLKTDISLVDKLTFGIGNMFTRIAVIGDSLSSGQLENPDGIPEHGFGDVYGQSWLSNLANKFNAKRNHYSEAGLTTEMWIKGSGYAVGDNYLQKMQSDNAFNAYFIALGTNDTSPTKVTYGLGSITDVAGTDSFVGYYKQIVEAVRAKAPNAVIFCVSLYQDTNPYKRYSDMVKQISDLYDKCYYIDYCANCGGSKYWHTGPDAINSGMAVGFHFSTIGYNYAASVIYKCMIDIIKDNVSDFITFGAYNSQGSKYDE